MANVNWEIILLAMSILAVGVGWFVQHFLEVRQERRARKDELRVKFLIESYLQTSDLVFNGLKTVEDYRKLQKLMNTAFLLGDIELIDELRKFEKRGIGGISLKGSHKVLRKELREHLGLGMRSDDPPMITFAGWIGAGVDAGKGFGPRKRRGPPPPGLKLHPDELPPEWVKDDPNFDDEI